MEVVWMENFSIGVKSLVRLLPVLVTHVGSQLLFNLNYSSF